MEQKEFLFRCRPLTGDGLLPQIAEALEKRTECVSREKFPDLWHCTDQLNEHRKKIGMTPKRQKWADLILVILGVILFVPGVVKPRENLVLLLLGGAGILFGLGEFLRCRRKPGSRFELAARHLLASRGLIADDEVRVRFTEAGMTTEEPQGSATLTYEELEYVLETPDTFLVTYQGKVLLLLKRDLDGEPLELRAFLSQRTKYHRV